MNLAGGDSRSSERRYGSFDHLIAALALQPDQLMAIFTAYFDESGTPHDSRFVVVAGYLAAVGAWRRFNARWGAVLAAYKVPYFHMREYAHSIGAYDGWKGKEAKRARFLKTLIKQIERGPRYGFRAIVDVLGWKIANQKYGLDTPEIDGGVACYPLAGKLCVELVKLWCRKHQFPFNGVEFVFHNGNPDKGKLIRRLEIDYGITPVLDPRLRGQVPVPGVQAADLLASETGKQAPQIARGSFDGSRDPRKSFVGLEFGVAISTVVYDFNMIEKLALSAGFPARIKEGANRR